MDICRLWLCLKPGVCVEKSSRLSSAPYHRASERRSWGRGCTWVAASSLFSQPVELFENLSSCSLWPGFFLFVCLPSDRNTVKVKAAFYGMQFLDRRGRGLTVTSGVNLGAFCSVPLDISLFLGESVSQRIWSLGATGDHRTEFLTTGPARQPAPWT